ncbi:MAG: hypothetical protein QXO51_05675 [Halobacteria archaeon]
MQCEICGRSRKVHFFDLAERTRFLNHALHHSLTLCQGCADSVQGFAGASEGLYALARAAVGPPLPSGGFPAARPAR